MEAETVDTDVHIDTLTGIYTKTSTGEEIPGHAVNIVGFIKDVNGNIKYLKIRGSWGKCDVKKGFALLPWNAVVNHLYNVIIAENGAGITKRKRKGKSKKIKKSSKNKRKQTRRRLKK